MHTRLLGAWQRPYGRMHKWFSAADACMSGVVGGLLVAMACNYGDIEGLHADACISGLVQQTHA
jgi:hypothetical protein